MKSSTTNRSSLSVPTLRRRVFTADSLLLNTAREKKNRLLSIWCYFGLAPFLWFSGVMHQRNRFLNHHITHGLAFSFTVLAVALFGSLIDSLGYWYVIDLWQPTLAEYFANTPYQVSSMILTYGSALILVLWIIAWLVSLIGARRGRTPHIPLISWIASRPRVLNVAVYWSLLVELFLLILIGLGLDSVRLTNSMPEKGKVYVLYTVGGYLPVPGLYETYTPPRWMITTAFYPLVQAGLERYGEGSVSILPLSEETFNTAIQNGRLIFVASHGGMSPGAFTISNVPFREYKPTDVDPVRVGERLQYVYFAGCYTGNMESEWRQVLDVETANMFGRLSTVEEHMLWVWFKSPGIIAGLED
ncbi:MAG: hypothetical protein AB1649_02570 [Chloroflexota bacterium]